MDKASIVNTNPSAPVFTPGILSVGSVLNGTVKLNNLKVKSVTSVAGYLISTNGTQNGRIVASNCDFEANLSTALYAHCGNSQDGTDNGSGTPTLMLQIPYIYRTLQHVISALRIRQILLVTLLLT